MQRLRLFSICSNSSQRNSIFILYNKGAVREEQKNILPRCHAGNENRASPAETGRRGPFKKYCPLLMRGNSQGSGQTTNHLLTAANVWEFSYTASAAFSSFPRRWLFLFGYGLNLSVSLRSPAPLIGEPLAKPETPSCCQSLPYKGRWHCGAMTERLYEGQPTQIHARSWSKTKYTTFFACGK